MCFWQIGQNDSLPTLRDEIFSSHSIPLDPPHNISQNWVEETRNVENLPLLKF